MNAPEPQKMLSSGAVGKLFGSDAKTVNRWAEEGKLISVRTPGGHRRFPAAQFAAVIEAMRKAQEAAS